MKRLSRLFGVGLLTLSVVTPATIASNDALDHRDDYRMNFIGGGDFRQYISDHVGEDDLWANAMRVFGTFHNQMHELMSDLARYDIDTLGGDQVPDFDLRISGGQWTEYRKGLAEHGHAYQTWENFVQIFEIMHDRVHHAMFKATVYDNESRSRSVDLTAYTDPDRTGWDFDDTTPADDEINLQQIERRTFRHFAWHYDFEHQRQWAAMQKMIVFDDMLYDLMHQWAEYGLKKGAGCGPSEISARITADEWTTFAASIQGCRDATWREFVQVVDLMHQRINQMMYHMVRHDAAAHDREDRIDGLLR